MLIGDPGLGGIAGKSVGATQLEMRQYSDRSVQPDPAMVEDFWNSITASLL